MTRLASIILLALCCRAPLAAQSKVGDRPAEAPETSPFVVLAATDSAAPPAPGDRPMDGKPLGERIVGGAVVGAVTGGVLSAQDSDCAPSASPRGAVLLGAAWGAIRGALGWDISDDPPPPSDTRDNGGEEGPYPFDGQNCKRAEPDPHQDQTASP